MTIRRVAFVVHDGKSEATGLEDELSRALSERGLEVADESDADLVVSLGGDGTVLRAAQVAHAVDVPLLGINVGRLGYLTEAESADGIAALDAVLSNEYHVEERMMLACELRSEADRDSWVALNEVLVERAGAHRLVQLEVAISGEELAAFNADGVIVATPTGSTAYALSAGGPIVSPRASVLVVVPVNAHMIFSRPFVLAPEDVVRIELGGARQEATLVLDGRSAGDLKTGAVVEVSRHSRPLRLVRLQGPGFVERLRVKLDMPGRGRPG